MREPQQLQTKSIWQALRLSTFTKNFMNSPAAFKKEGKVGKERRSGTQESGRVKQK